MSTLTHDRRLLPFALAAIAVTALVLVFAVGSQWFRAGERSAPAAREAAGAPEHPAGHAEVGANATPVGYAPVMIEPSRLPALGLRLATVEERPLNKTLRTVGAIALDETRTAHVHSRVRGWIDRIHVDFVGKEVKAGEVLCTIYSQEVYAAEIELLATPAGPLLEAARRRLLLWDVPRSEIARLESSREARRSFPLLAPRSGTVVAKQALAGMYVDASNELYTLSDLSRVWVQADVYEAEVARVRAGTPATLRVEGLEKPVVAAAAFLSPTLDEVTRTRKVRFELPNPDGTLLPGAFVTVEISVELGNGLTVPEDAVIRTGTRSIVFVAQGEPPQHFEPREVTLGPLVGELYRVEKGLSAGERVATGAQFLLDSESRLRASSGGGHAHSH
jgi:membrane fusion protein, copper/silver efflux system